LRSQVNPDHQPFAHKSHVSRYNVICEPICAVSILDRIVHDEFRLEPEGQRMGKPSPNWMTTSFIFDTRKSVRYGNALQVAECVGTGGWMSSEWPAGCSAMRTFGIKKR
jgi:hypothetical protein